MLSRLQGVDLTYGQLQTFSKCLSHAYKSQHFENFSRTVTTTWHADAIGSYYVCTPLSNDHDIPKR